MLARKEGPQRLREKEKNFKTCSGKRSKEGILQTVRERNSNTWHKKTTVRKKKRGKEGFSQDSKKFDCRRITKKKRVRQLTGKGSGTSLFEIQEGFAPNPHRPRNGKH